MTFLEGGKESGTELAPLFYWSISNISFLLAMAIAVSNDGL